MVDSWLLLRRDRRTTPTLETCQKPTGKPQSDRKRHKAHKRAVEHERALTPVRVTGHGRFAAQPATRLGLSIDI